MFIQLTDDLKYHSNRLATNKKYFMMNFHEQDTDNKFIHNYDNLEGEFFHKNYLTYLETCWDAHLGVELTPDILWFDLLCEVAEIVSDDPERHRDLFSTKLDKQEIVIVQDGFLIEVEELYNRLTRLVPTDTTLFLPKFSTTTDNAHLAKLAAFADMVSPYYDYSICMCGIPSITVRGTKEDWIKIRENWFKVALLIKTHAKYFEKVYKILYDIVKNFCDNNIVSGGCVRQYDVDFWKEMIKIEKCGSGTDVELRGWYTQLFRKQPKYNLPLAHNFSPHLAKVPYKWKAPGIELNFVLYHGLLSSKVKEGVASPEFGCTLFEKKD